MKNILVLVIFISGIATSGYSQFIKKGTIVGGGSVEFTSQKSSSSSNKQSSLSFMPWGGYLVIDNLVAGALLQISRNTFDNTSGKTTITGFLIGPVARYYMDNGLFGHAQFGFGSGKIKNEPVFVGSESKSSDSELRLGAGYAIRITDTVLFEPIVGFLSRSSKDKTSNVKFTDNGFFLMANFTIFIRSNN